MNIAGIDSPFDFPEVSNGTKVSGHVAFKNRYVAARLEVGYGQGLTTCGDVCEKDPNCDAAHFDGRLALENDGPGYCYLLHKSPNDIPVYFDYLCSSTTTDLEEISYSCGGGIAGDVRNWLRCPP